MNLFCYILLNISITIVGLDICFIKSIVKFNQCGFWCSRSTTDHIFCIR